MTAGVVVAALVVLAAVAIAVAVQRRGVRRRVASALVRLDPESLDLEGRGGLERTLAALERGVDRAVARDSAASAAVERLARVLDALPQGIVVWDERGEEVHRNPAAAGYVGGRHGAALVEQAVHELRAEALEGGRARRSLDLYGPPRQNLELSAVAFDEGRGTIGALVVIDDVSDRRRLEEVRRDFVANISHELKTPIGALGLLAETIAAEDRPEVARRLAGRMEGEAARVGRIVDDLLDLSRIEAEERPRREPVPVHLVVAEAVDRVRGLAEHRRIRLDVEGVPTSLSVRGDRRQLVSAVFNLLENAVKYSEEGSSVELVARGEPGWVELEVGDHGIGIPARDLERVFERFYRVDRARSRQTGGTGLGLAIVRHVATNHGGEVAVSSIEGEGSRFTLRLPAGAASTTSSLPAGTGSGGGLAGRGGARG